MINHWLNTICRYTIKYNGYYYLFEAISVADALNKIQEMIGGDKMENLLSEGLEFKKTGKKSYFVNIY